MTHVSRKNFLLAGTAALLLVLPPVYFFNGHRPEASEPVEALTHYLKAIYARDFARAYRFLSRQDRGLKKESVYVREHGPFGGFALEVARKLSESIQIRPVQERLGEAGRTRVKVAYSLPDANAIAPLVWNWDEERLNAASSDERQKIIASLEHLIRQGTLKIITGEEEFLLVKESGTWKIFLNWAAAIRVRFNTVVPSGHLIEARPTIRETLARSGEPFMIEYQVKNLTSRDLFARVAHNVEPVSLAEHLDLVECGLLIPVRLKPGEKQSYTSTYLIRNDLPDGVKELRVTYEFKVEG